jgi:hypothetical protein
VLALDFLAGVAPAFCYAALIAWVAAFIGLLRRLLRLRHEGGLASTSG